MQPTMQKNLLQLDEAQPHLQSGLFSEELFTKTSRIVLEPY
jgi:hypothetical protein